MAAPENGNGIKEQVGGLTEHKDRHQKNIDELFSKYEGVGRTNWQIVLSAIAVLVVVVGGLWGLTAAPINSDINRFDKVLGRHETGLSSHTATLSVHQTEIERLKETQRVFRDLMRRVEDERLPTREFIIHQAANSADRTAVQRQIDALNTKIDAVFPPSKVLEDLVRRLSELERTRALTAAKP